MSLDVYLTLPNVRKVSGGSGIFVRQNGQTVEISREEWDRSFPGREPIVVRADDEEEDPTVFSANITHNLNSMAEAAGIYRELWRPEEIGISKAEQLIAPLRAGLERMRSDPDKYRALNPENGWGSYAYFLPWIEEYLKACERFPRAEVSVSR